ncbi:asparagine synthase (glutamine-hydrolyzing) [Solirubrobacter soli]|uniref:asparagine synthase (glutamine-hydrolyzing) n=1 Tax=Solirubrobacter soli TaxID=363832 RepID=UPI0004053052|nr:asparagine synthase (glutamine-hydrolyzing) [Solirubrobacter soli]
MCGIGALLDPAGIAGPSTAEAMVRALRHRGPDGDDWRRVGPALLVHTRLSIIDVAGGDQPFTSEDGTITLVANGEIYNYLELRAGLEQRGHTFASRSDCEIILHLYEEDGPECVHKLNGIFGFTLWDARRQRLVAARDAFGVKPVYWAERGRRVAVGSEVGAVLAAGLGSTMIDPIALDHFLAWRFVPAPRTLFAGVQKLPAASYLVAEVDQPVKVTSYRTAPGASFDASPAELADGLAHEFGQAVGRQMMSDVPYGAFLSGGIDSAGIAAAMTAHDDKPIQTFTIGFPGHDDTLDERAAAEASAKVIGTDHHSVAMSATDFRGQIRDTIHRLEEPCGIPSAPALLQLSEFTTKSVTVVLSGQGADEPLGGYSRHQAAAMLQYVAKLPGAVAGPARRLAGALPRNEKAKRAAGLLGAGDATDRLLGIFDIAPSELRAALTGADGSEAAAERRALAEAVLDDVRDRDPLEQTLYLDTHLFLPDGLLIYGDKMSMAHGLEQRVPFLDVELMRYVERIPAKVRVKGLKRKWLHKQAMAKLVPREIIDRPKLGFSTPYDRWLREELGSEVARRFAPGTDLAATIDPATVSALVSGHQSGRADNKRLLYCLLELSEWQSLFSGAEAPELVAS